MVYIFLIFLPMFTWATAKLFTFKFPNVRMKFYPEKNPDWIEIPRQSPVLCCLTIGEVRGPQREQPLGQRNLRPFHSQTQPAKLIVSSTSCLVLSYKLYQEIKFVKFYFLTKSSVEITTLAMTSLVRPKVRKYTWIYSLKNIQKKAGEPDASSLSDKGPGNKRKEEQFWEILLNFFLST